MNVLLVVLVLLIPGLAAAAGLTAAPVVVPVVAAGEAAPTAPDYAVITRKLQENSSRIVQISRGLPKIGSLVIAARKGGVVGDVVQLPLVQLGAVNTGDTLDKYIIASSRKGYLFSWPDGSKLYVGNGRYFAAAGCTGQSYVRFEFLPLAAQYLGAVFVDGGKLFMVAPRRNDTIAVQSFRDGSRCVDAQESGVTFGAVLTNAASVSGVPDVASFADDFRLGVD